MSTIHVPILDADLTFAVPPYQVLFNGSFLFRMTAVVRIIQCKFLQRCKVTLDAIEPRGIRRRPVELNIVRGRVRLHLRFVMVGNTPAVRKRPDAHANELFWWRQGDLANLLDDFGRKLPRPGRPAKARLPRNSLNAAAIEAVNNGSDPGRRAAALFGNPGVGAAAARQQNNSRMKPVDSIG